MKTKYLELLEWKSNLNYYRQREYKINQPRHGDSVFTIQGQGIHTRFVNLDKCYEFVLPNGHTDIMLAGEAARKTLEFFYPCGYEAQGSYRYIRRNPPMWISDFVYGTPCHYIDFVGAYWVIARRLWLDLIYNASLSPNVRHSMPLNRTLDYLYSWKAARNAVIGLTYSNQQVRWWENSLNRRRYLKIIRFNNKFFNPSLWCTVNEILQDIAHIAIRCGAIYIATDGYIMTDNKNVEKFTRVLDNLGLANRYRHYYGLAYIEGWGAYSIEDKAGSGSIVTTKRFLEYQRREKTNPPLEPPVKMRLPLIRRRKLFLVSHHNRCKKYKFLRWWAGIKEPSINKNIKNNIHKKVNRRNKQ